MPRPKIAAEMATSTAAAAGWTSHVHGPFSMPSKARLGSHATRPAGTTVSKPVNANAGKPSSGNTLSSVIMRHVELLISSAARGAQKARLPQAYSNASTMATEETRLTHSRAIQPGETTTGNWPNDHTSMIRPGTNMPAPVTGAKPSVSSTIQTGCG